MSYKIDDQLLMKFLLPNFSSIQAMERQQYFTMNILIFLLFIGLVQLQETEIVYQPMSQVYEMNPSHSTAIIKTTPLRPSKRSNPIIKSITINQTYVYPQSMVTELGLCFGNTLLEISENQELRVEASAKFMLFVTTIVTDMYYDIQQYYGKGLEEITLNRVVIASEASNTFVAMLPLSVKCRYKIHPYFRIKAILHADFYEEGRQERHELNMLLVCANEQDISAFAMFFVPGYVIFWLSFNLTLQIYHNYPRTLDHFALFLVYLACSVLLTNDVLAYIIAGTLHLLIVIKEFKAGTINNKTFSLYLTFTLLVVAQIIMTFRSGKEDQLMNNFWILLDNFIILHITMFLVLRLVKLSRLRHVFWYFVATVCFVALYADNNNRFFEIQFKNPLNLSCIKMNLFFPLMMLPISNFYSTITSWMHRVVSLVLLITAVLPLWTGIKFTACVFIAILLWQIKNKNVDVISHRS